MKLPATNMLPRVMRLISEELQEIWDCCAGNELHAIIPTVSVYKRKTSLSRHDSVLINRLYRVQMFAGFLGPAGHIHSKETRHCTLTK